MKRAIVNGITIVLNMVIILAIALSVGGTAFASDNYQRVNKGESTLNIVREEVYYNMDGRTWFYFEVSGTDTQNFEVKLFVDKEEKDITKSEYKDVYYTLDMLSVGQHEMEVRVCKGALAIDSYKGTFLVENFTGKYMDDKKYLSEGSIDEENYLDLTILSSANQKVSEAFIIDENGNVISDMYYKYEYTNMCYLVHIYENIPMYSSLENEMTWNHLCFEVPNRVNYLNPGVYDLKIISEDGTSYVIEDVLEVVPSTSSVISYARFSFDYDNYSDYLYVELMGKNIDTNRVTVKINKDGVEKAVTKENVIHDKYGEVIKLKKDGWSIDSPYEFDITIIPDKGYELINARTFKNVYIPDGVYFIGYNSKTKKIEAGVSSNFKGTTVYFTLSKDDDEDKIIAEATEIIENDITSIDFKGIDGSAFNLEQNTGYRVNYIIDNASNGNYYVYTSSETNEVGANVLYGEEVVAKGDMLNRWILTDIPVSLEAPNKLDIYLYDENGKEILLDEDDLYLNISEYQNYNSSIKYVEFDIYINTDVLSTGKYKITAKLDEEHYYEGEFNVIEKPNKFIMVDDYLYPSWEDNDLLLEFSTLNRSVEDEYEVIIRDINGNLIENLTTTVENIMEYSNRVTLKVQGLINDQTVTKYYIKIVHKKYGEAYDINGNLVFDDKGIFIQVSNKPRNGLILISDSRNMVGFELYNDSSYPTALFIYRAYDGTLVYETTIDQSELVDNEYYYFKKEMIESCIDPYVAYKVVVQDNDGVLYTASAHSLGYYERPEVRKEITITKQPENIECFVNDSIRFTVDATGDNLTYEWQYKPVGGKKWMSFSGGSDAVMKKRVLEKWDGWTVSCLIRDGYGNELRSDEITITIIKEAVKTFAITKQPENIEQYALKTITFSVEVVGEGITYQWQYKTRNSNKWNDFSSGDQSVMTKTLLEKWDGWKVSCLITDKDGDQLRSDEVTIHVLPKEVIKEETDIQVISIEEICEVFIDEEAVETVEAEKIVEKEEAVETELIEAEDDEAIDHIADTHEVEATSKEE